MAPTPVRPFRWNLVDRDQLGSLVDASSRPSLWFFDDLVECAAKVLARSRGGRLRFVGRSADSVHDLLAGALAETSWRRRIDTMPLSIRLLDAPLAAREISQLRANLAAAGAHPFELARRDPVVFVDLVCSGSTFTGLHQVLRAWAAEERAPWDVIRTKLTFIGITSREHTSPKTWRWHQHQSWTKELPSSAIRNVSLDLRTWRYFGNDQPKLTASFVRSRWASGGPPRHDAIARAALAEAVAVTERGRTAKVRHALARHIADEPTIVEPWLRALALELRA